MEAIFNPNSPEFYSWVVLPLLIFLARVADVTLGTIRIIFVSRGRRRIAPLLGFFEVLIWVIAIGQLVQHLDSATSFIGYAAGFAAGNFVGMYIEERLAIGTFIVRAIIQTGGDEVMEHLKTAGYGVTVVDGQGSSGPVKLVYTVVKRKHLQDVLKIIHGVQPKAFISVEDLRVTAEGIFPTNPYNQAQPLIERKGK
jgi:uncharacterized protein YebE (UPF0316 family)